ncbi:MAG: endonuclease [Candidatus Berkiella sp.]
MLGLILMLMSLPCYAGPKHFQEAKKQAFAIWSEHKQTFYCGCDYDKHGNINFKSCSYEPSDYRHDKRVSWEHVVPVSWFGKSLDCWNKPICKTKNGKIFKGRKCCSKRSELFRAMETDLHNLVPAIRDVNSHRENYRFSEFAIDHNKERFFFNHCPIIIDERYGLVEPPDVSKGMVARISLYMAAKYGIDLGEWQHRLLTDWNHRYPVTAWEIKWNRKVCAIQGDSNYYIDKKRFCE